MASCIKPGQPLKIVLTFGQSVPYGSDATPVVSVNPGTALTYVDGPRKYSAMVHCTKEVLEGRIGETPCSALGNYIQNKVDYAMGRNRSPQILSVSISQPAAGIRELVPYERGSLWKPIRESFEQFPRIRSSVEAPSAECIACVLYHGDKDGRDGNMQANVYLEYLERSRKGLEELAKAYISQTSPMRMFIFINSNSALWHHVQDAYMRVATTGNAQNKYFIIGPTYNFGRADPTQNSHNSGYGNYIAGIYAGRAIYQFQYENRVPDHIRPIKWSRKGGEIVVYYRVPTPPLVRKDLSVPGGNPSAAKLRYPNDGYSVYTTMEASKDTNIRPQKIDSILIDGTMVKITCNELAKFTGKVYLTYALWNLDMMVTDYGTQLGGNVCDSTTETHVMPTGEEYELRHWMPNHLLEI